MELKLHRQPLSRPRRPPLAAAWALAVPAALLLVFSGCSALYFPESNAEEKFVASRDLCLDPELEFGDSAHPRPDGVQSVYSRTATVLHLAHRHLEGELHTGETLPEAMRRIYGRDIMLSEAMLNEGIGNIGDLSRLRAVARKLVKGQPIKVVAVGASVTLGHGARNQRNGYISRFFSWIEETFPDVPHELINHAIPAVSSSYVAPCLLDLVPADVDLVLLELTFNDNAYGGHKLEDPIPRSFERILRKLLRLHSEPAIVYLHYWGARVENFSFAGNQVEDLYDTMLKYYGLMSLSMRSAVHRLQLKNQTALEELFPAPWNPDAVHPTCVGHRFLADMLIGHLQDLAAAEMLSHFLASHGDGRRLSHMLAGGDGLRPPLQAGNDGERFERCITEPDTVLPLIRTIQGFEWHDEGRKKFGAIGWRVGDVLELDVPVAGRQAQLTLGVGFLTSYDHMGQAAVKCVSGCSCRRREFNLIHPEHMSITLWRVVEATLQPGAAVCTLRVSTLDRTASGEHKVKVTSVMISEEPGFVMTWLHCPECAQ